MCDITRMFTAVRKALDAVDVYNRTDIFQTIMREMELDDRGRYLAMKAYGFPMYTGINREQAYSVLGKERVDEWIERGSLSDDFHPLAYMVLDHWYDPIARQEYYEEYLANNTPRKTGTVSVRLHPNFTLAEIEHTVRNALRD